MFYKKNTLLILWIILAASFMPIHPAHAYIDPGTGSYVLQILIGIFFGASYAIIRFWKSIVNLFKKILGKFKK